VKRKWTSFHTPTTDREALAIPESDRIRLFEAMGAFRHNLGAGYRVESYGDGLWMITDGGRGQGRCLFFKRFTNAVGVETLVAVLFYKKESGKAPDRIVKVARKRMAIENSND
jgi:phage-related protein